MPRTWTSCSSRKTATGAKPRRTGGHPEQTLRQKDFMRVLEACVEKLPGQQGRLFMMREWLELDTDEICKGAGDLADQSLVMLHRARLRLRGLLCKPAGLTPTRHMKLKVTCKEVTHLLLHAEDKPLPWLARLRIHLHMRICDLPALCAPVGGHAQRLCRTASRAGRLTACQGARPRNRPGLRHFLPCGQVRQRKIV